MGSQLRIQVDPAFSLPHRVCSYGYFVLAPNRWVPDVSKKRPAGQLIRPVVLNNDNVSRIAIKQSFVGKPLLIECDQSLHKPQQKIVKDKIIRMLRIKEDFSGWHHLHQDAKRDVFDCIFRSPTLFEDMVKTITSCNVTWQLTRKMNWLLCQRYGHQGSFPTPESIVQYSAEEIKQECKVGYRAERILRLAQSFVSGDIQPEWYEATERTSEELYKAVKTLYGFGDYAASNMLQLLGHYDRLAVDSELISHFKRTYNASGSTKEITDQAWQHYDQYQPYAFLAYWYELWVSLEEKNGPRWKWTDPEEGHVPAVVVE